MSMILSLVFALGITQPNVMFVADEPFVTEMPTDCNGHWHSVSPETPVDGSAGKVVKGTNKADREVTLMDKNGDKVAVLHPGEHAAWKCEKDSI